MRLLSYSLSNNIKTHQTAELLNLKLTVVIIKGHRAERTSSLSDDGTKEVVNK